MKLLDAINGRNEGRPPVWFMRQAGRYHSHYQRLRAQHSFIDLCKKPDLACEVTLGPIRDFGFDAAILFSDLLFPLEAMGMGLTYDEGPKLDWHLESSAELRKLRGGAELAVQMDFQAQAMRKIRDALPAETGLLGFVGAPLTLFFYAVEGSHQGDLAHAKRALEDGRFDGFCEKLLDLLAANMALQARAGANAMAVFDTCAGEIGPDDYARLAVPALDALLSRFRALCPDTPVVYYSRGTGPEHWRALERLHIACLGVDWRHPLERVLEEWSGNFSVQGNIDPQWLFLDSKELERRLREAFGRVKALSPHLRRGWIAGLGHGVLPKTPEENVRLFLRVQKELFR